MVCVCVCVCRSGCRRPGRCPGRALGELYLYACLLNPLSVERGSYLARVRARVDCQGNDAGGRVVCRTSERVGMLFMSVDETTANRN